MTLTEPQASSTAILDGLKIIDTDSHFTEPPDLWLSRGPSSWKDRLPTQRTVDGKTHWFLDGQPWASIGGNTLRRGREKVLGEWVMHPFEAIDPVRLEGQGAPGAPRRDRDPCPGALPERDRLLLESHLRHR